MPGTLKESYEQRNTLAADLKAQQERVHAGTEVMDETKWEEWNKKMDDHIAISKHIQNLEAMERMVFDQAKNEIDKKIEPAQKKNANQVFSDFLRNGFVDEESRSILGELKAKGAKFMGDTRAATDPQSSTTSAGGYLIPEGFQAELEKAMLPYFQLLEACRILPTASGNDIPWPTVNDTANKGRLIDENASSAVKNITFGQLILKAFMFTSDIVKCPLQLLQDEAIGLEGVVADLLGERLGRILSDYMTTGTGISQPEGIVYAATDAALASVAATALTRDNILDLKFSVNEAYRSAPGAAFMMHDTTVKALAKLTYGTSDDRPLWQASIQTGQPATIEGKPYFVNNSMDEIGAGNNPVIFGDLKKFMIRKVLGTTMFIFREKYMEELQLGFLAYNRWDSRMVDAGTHPIKKITQSNT